MLPVAAPTDALVAFTPKGGCPLKRAFKHENLAFDFAHGVAFTPKGGCPLKHLQSLHIIQPWKQRSIHPQGWVPIETKAFDGLDEPYK